MNLKKKYDNVCKMNKFYKIIFGVMVVLFLFGIVSATTVIDSDSITGLLNLESTNISADNITSKQIGGVIYADQYATVNDAINASDGIVQFGNGTYPITNTITYSKPLLLRGSGSNSILRVNDGVFVTSGIIFRFGSAGGENTYTFENLVVDGNGDGQDFSSSGINDYYHGVAGNPGAAHQAYETLILDDVEYRNITMKGGGGSRGLAINTFGARNVVSNGYVSNQNDVGIWITRPFILTPTDYVFTNTIIKNNHVDGVYFECTGDTIFTNFQIYNDTFPASNGTSGITIWTCENNVKNIVISNGHFENLAFPVNIGGGGSCNIHDSRICNLIANNSRGSFRFEHIDESVHVSDIIANNLAYGGISGTSIFGSFELGNSGNTNLIRFSNLRSNNSQHNGIRINQPTEIVGGGIYNQALVAIENTAEYVQIKDVDGQAGYNHGNNATAPTPFGAGDSYYNTTDNIKYCYNGTAWNALW